MAEASGSPAAPLRQRSQSSAELAGETLHKYADLLRIGRLSMNGFEITWDNSSSNDAQLKAFCNAFVSAVRRLPGMSGLEDSVLYRTAHLTCKAVSINYALSEVISLLQSRLGRRFGGEMCKIQTMGASGKSCLDYGVDIRRGGMMHAYVNWRGRGNIISCNLETAKQKVRGTLSSVETEFPMIPEPGFKPTYRLQMEVQRPRMARLASSIAGTCGSVRPAAVEAVCPMSPLNSPTASKRGTSSQTEEPARKEKAESESAKYESGEKLHKLANCAEPALQCEVEPPEEAGWEEQTMSCGASSPSSRECDSDGASETSTLQSLESARRDLHDPRKSSGTQRKGTPAAEEKMKKVKIRIEALCCVF